MATRFLRGPVLAAAIVWASAAAPAWTAPPQPKPGVFLYASPALGDPNFVETVVLLVQHDADGSMGLVVNRPTRVPVREAVDALAEIRGLELRLYEGGPVQRDVMLALARTPKRIADAHRVLPDVQLSSEPKRWKDLARDPEAESRLRVYAGYAGWGPGQLARELRLGSWVVAPADARSVFSSDPSELWPRVHGLMKRLEARARPPGPSFYCRSLLLTNAIMRPSGDQDGTLIVPCPPYT
jgi:putative transcriptional regulator